MNEGAYYNEHDPYAAQWLRNLIAAGHIAPGIVDERSIVDVRADDLRGYRQCHFFAGIGVWSYALRRAGWPDDREVWTGSCPCQPYSDAGKGEAFDDERDLWPAWTPLIRGRRPGTILGEQVASKVGLAWLDLVHADLEAEADTVGAIDTCSAGFGAPHIRQRFYFVAHAGGDRRPARSGDQRGAQGQGGEHRDDAVGCGRNGGLEHASSGGRGERGHAPLPRGGRHPDRADEPCIVVDPEREGREGLLGPGQLELQGGARQVRPARAPGPSNGFWADAQWIHCRDGYARPVEPGTFPLAHGAPARVGRLRAYGNAINAEQARCFIEACMSVMP